MPLVINTDPAPMTVEREVSGDFGSFTIVIKTPTIPERHKSRSLQYREEVEERCRYLLGFLIDWRDVFDAKGNAIPFTANFDTVFRPNGSVLQAVVLRIAELFDEDLGVISKDAEKNSEGPRVSTDVAAAETPIS